MVFCEHCGSDNDSSARFCRSCGKELEAQKESFQKPTFSSGEEGVGFGSRSTGENLVLHCSLCGGRDFAKDTGRLDSKWGFTSFKVVMLTCRRCGHIELFNKGRSIFDFD
ncbi:MAG: zinc-ribbon domain-containing protein [Candidatus Odinarchaeota archaeon]